MLHPMKATHCVFGLSACGKAKELSTVGQHPSTVEGKPKWRYGIRFYSLLERVSAFQKVSVAISISFLIGCHSLAYHLGGKQTSTAHAIADFYTC